MMPRKPYPSDLSDAEWEKIAPLLPATSPIGRPREVDVRELEDKEYFREITGGMDLNKINQQMKSYGDWNPETTRRVEFMFKRI